MTDRELMQQALDALERHVLEYETVEALRARLAQPYAAQAAMVDQQTQGRMYVDPVTGDVGIGNPNQVTLDTSGATGFSLTPIQWDASAPLVTTPHPAFKKPWVGLTDEEMDEAMDYWSDRSRSAYGGAHRADGEYVDMRDTWRYIEAKLKEKNT